MKLIDQLPQQVKITGDIAAPATAGAYMAGFLPATWGEWAACLAGLWALLQIINFLYNVYAGFKEKRARSSR